MKYGSESNSSWASGVSFNKIFAKLGSDMKKPDATTVILREEFRNIVWPLPVEDLLFVGPATKKKFYRRMIYTIGDLANSDVREMERMLGKNGRTLWAFANGLDNSPVAENGDVPPIESIGNSMTMPRDLISDKDVKITIMVLAESIASRMRNAHVKCTTVQISVRDNELRHYERKKSWVCRLQQPPISLKQHLNYINNTTKMANLSAASASGRAA